MSLEIRTISMEQIKPAPYNPRVDLTPANKEYKHIQNSIDKFGYIEPIIWNETSGYIVGGHQRYKILKAQGVTEVQVIVVHFDEETEKACNLALNRAVGQWDDDKLDILLLEMQSKNYNMADFGFEEVDFSWDDVPELSENEYDEPQKKTIKCPFCHHVDTPAHFKKASKPQEDE